jgi:hypothetical protein
MAKQQKNDEAKPDYVVALEDMFGPPSMEGFGSAVFFEMVDDTDDLEEVAKQYYQHFVGELWERWGEEAWMAPWQEVYVRKAQAKHDVVKELEGVEALKPTYSVPLLVEGEDKAGALAAAYDAPQVVDLRVYNIGDGEAMSGLIVAGQRENGEATFVVFLMD